MSSPSKIDNHYHLKGVKKRINNVSKKTDSMDHKRVSFLKKSVKIFGVVSLYWIFSISLVFLNKYLLSSEDIKFSGCPTVSYMALPLTMIFVGMITFNNLCLKHVGISFYYIGRSLTTVFNVICTYLILGENTSKKTIFCCAIIIGGFFLGINQEDVSGLKEKFFNNNINYLLAISGSLSIWGLVFGVSASLCVSLNAIYTKKTLPFVGDNIWRLTLYNNFNACFLFPPLMIATGDLWRFLHYDNLTSATFWALMTLSGFFGFIMSYITGLQIQVTSPLTHNISGTAKAGFQTIIAVIWWQEYKPLLWWLSNAVVFGGSGAYAHTKQEEMRLKHFKNEPILKTGVKNERQHLLINCNDASDQLEQIHM